MPLAALLLAACSGPTAATPTPTLGVRASATPPPANVVPTATIEFGEGLAVTITDAGFSPAALLAPLHGTVSWTNAGESEHALTAEAADAPASFTSEPLAPGDTYTFTFEAPGDYAYYSRLHPELRGLVRVVP